MTIGAALGACFIKCSTILGSIIKFGRMSFLATIAAFFRLTLAFVVFVFNVFVLAGILLFGLVFRDARYFRAAVDL